jgi:hypothetical protein
MIGPYSISHPGSGRRIRHLVGVQEGSEVHGPMGALARAG